jgi:hypothetical protein
MFAIKSGPVMGPKQLHFRRETVIRRHDTICQTESATLLDSGVTKTASVKILCPQKIVCPYFGIVKTLCFLINVCVYCRCEPTVRTLYIQLTSNTCFGEKQQLA